MNYVDFAIAVSLFLFFFGLVILYTTNYFSNISTLTKRVEYREVAANFFNQFFSKKGTPSNWENDTTVAPVELGLAVDLYQIPVLVTETGSLSRSEEPILFKIEFDSDCTSKVWNNTVRVYDEDDNETRYELSDVTFCSSQYLQEANITWNVNASAAESISYWVYYSGDSTISGPGYPDLAQNTSSWVPTNGDDWTEATTDWSRYGGASGTVVLDSSSKRKGSYSVNITGTFNVSVLGLQYNPSANITGVDNDWFIHGWVFVSDMTGIGGARVALSDNNESISINLASNLTSNTWYEFSVPLNANSGWTGWSSFNATKGIDYVTFYTTNSSGDLTRTLKIDNLYFTKKPLDVQVFPEKKIEAVSAGKLNALRNISAEQVRKIIGEGYKIRIEVLENK